MKLQTIIKILTKATLEIGLIVQEKLNISECVFPVNFALCVGDGYGLDHPI